MTWLIFADLYIIMLNKRTDIDYMRLALAEAQKALEIGEVPIGCIVVCNDRIVGRGYNMTEHLQDVTAHAEIQAISAASASLGGKYLKECTLYVTIEPCVMCAGAIGWAQIARVVYGAKDVKRGFSIYSPKALHPKCVITSGVLEDECGKLVTNFFKTKR